VHPREGENEQHHRRPEDDEGLLGRSRDPANGQHAGTEQTRRSEYEQADRLVPGLLIGVGLVHRPHRGVQRRHAPTEVEGHPPEIDQRADVERV
jgi:hypothetical protein